MRPEIKQLFQEFLDCKTNTETIAENGLVHYTKESSSHIIGEQEKCLKIIGALNTEDDPALAIYKEGLTLTQERVQSEMRLYYNITPDNYKDIARYKLSAGLIKMREDSFWQNVQVKKVNESNDFGTMSWLVWILFVFVTLILVLKKFKVDPEKLRVWLTPQEVKNDKKNDVNLTDQHKNE